MSGDSEQTQETQVRLSPELRGSAVSAQEGAQALFNQGTSGIFQGSRLAEQDALIRQAQEQQLALAGQGGDLANQVAQQQAAFTGLLGAGDINNPLVQRQIADLADVVGEQFNRTILPGISQGATGAGQFGSSRQGIAEGLAAGEAANAISRGATQALLGGQQVALQAQGLAPQSIGLGLLPTQIQQDIGGQRTLRSQAELEDRIQQFEAPRRAELQNLTEFTNLLAANPLTAESNQTTTQTQSSSDLQSALGVASLVAAPFTGGASLGLTGGLGSLFGGGGAAAGGGFALNPGQGFTPAVGGMFDLGG